MKQYGILQPLYMSFFSREIYKDVAQYWRGFCGLYLFIFALISQVTMFGFMVTAMPDLDTLSSDMTIQIPDIHIENGILRTPEKKIYHIYGPNFEERDYDENSLIGIIDTTGQYTNIDQTEGTYFLLTDKGFTIKKSNYETRSFSFSEMPEDVSITKEDMKGYIDMGITFIKFLWIPLMTIVFFVGYLLKTLIYSIIALVVGNIMKSNLEFSHLFRLAAISITPATIIDAVFLYGFGADYLGLLTIPITIGYIVFGVKANEI